LKFSESASQYAIELAKQHKNHLTGIFLDDKSYTSYKIYELILDQGVSEKKLNHLKQKDAHQRVISADKFDKLCKLHKIEYSIHHDRNIALQDLMDESIFADLLIIDFTESFTHYEEKSPSRFIRDLLSNSQCPVLLAPSVFQPIEKIVFLYDGTATSVYPIKLFSYLLNNVINLPMEIICVRSMDQDLHFPHHRQLKDLIKRHHRNIQYTILKGLPEIEIINHLQQENKKILAVLGAYRRTMVSRWFKSSLADALINQLKVPLFIAHNK